MPGRQVTAPRVQKQPKAKRQAKKRALNALAIAEQQAPERAQIRHHRLGEIDQSNDKRKRGGSLEESSDDVDDRTNTKRSKAEQKDRFGNEIEGGSDSEGNTWVLGQVNSDDDSDLDSDEAMGESDEDRFDGFTFRGSSVPKSRPKPTISSRDNNATKEGSHEIDLNEDDDENHELDEESDDFREEAIDLAAMLDASKSETEEGDKGGAKGMSVSEGDEILTDDEISTDDRGSPLSVTDFEDESTDLTKLSAIQDLVSSIDDGGATTNRRLVRDAQEGTTPSEFGLNSRQKLTVADLMSTVTDPRLRKSLKLLTEEDNRPNKRGKGIPQRLDVPLAKRQQDRLDRAAAYEKSKETLNRWIDTVKHNRRAEHVSFPLQDPDAVAAKGTTRLLPTTQSKPLTTLESTIKNILEDSGLGPTEEDQIQAFEELATNKLPIEEVQARRAELRKARELLFREEVRAKRIKKIKSKSYRRVHRRERERNAQQERDTLAAAGVDPSEDKKELNDRRRAEERMGARHRESKWAKGVKDSGRAVWDEDARGGVTEMARREEELRRRIEGKDIDAEDDDSFNSGTETSDEDERSNLDADEKYSRRLQNKLHKLNGSGPSTGIALGGQSALSSMAFMKRAERRRKEQNDADIERLRKDMDGEDSTESESGEVPGRKTYGPVNVPLQGIKSKKQVERGEFEEKSSSDDEGPADPAIQADDDVDVIVNEVQSRRDIFPSRRMPTITEQAKTKETLKGGDTPLFTDNPWLSSKKPRTKNREPSSSDKTVLISNTLDRDLTEATASAVTPKTKPKRASLHPESADNDAGSFSGFSSDSDTTSNPTLHHNRNQDLIRQAFAGDEVIASFEQEKQDTIRDEEEKTTDSTLPGWGAWTGTGISKREEKRNKGKVTVKIEGIKKEKRVDRGLEKVIINEKRVKKVCLCAQ